MKFPFMLRFGVGILTFICLSAANADLPVLSNEVAFIRSFNPFYTQPATSPP